MAFCKPEALGPCGRRDSGNGGKSAADPSFPLTSLGRGNATEDWSTILHFQSQCSGQLAAVDPGEVLPALERTAGERLQCCSGHAGGLSCLSQSTASKRQGQAGGTGSQRLAS